MSDSSPQTVLVTGGAGFIGSALVRQLIHRTGHRVVNVDKLTYAGNLESLKEIEDDCRYAFERADICDSDRMRQIFAEYRPGQVVHLAAESHVDRSIDGPGAFVRTNLLGSYALLDVALDHWRSLDRCARESFRFLQVSTDEVYGSLDDEGLFTEESPYDPSSPYSATKAGADHLARAWYRTYDFPVLVTNSSNNFGPHQFPEKLIPVVILSAKENRPIPVYGGGKNVRDWLYVNDHAEALLAVLEGGIPGESYNVGARNAKRNIEIVHAICSIMDEFRPDRAPHSDLVTFVPDRPGHDWRYAIDPSKVERELGWKPRESFETALRKTVCWYLENGDWCDRVVSGEYRVERRGIVA